jgi:hypothetical protein
MRGIYYGLNHHPPPPPNHSVLILPDHGFVTVKVFAMYALTTSVNGTTNFGNNGANILNIDEGSLEIIWNSITERFELNVAIDYVSVFGNTDKIPILKDIKYNVFRGSSLPNSV